jgi:hypothetical protein
MFELRFKGRTYSCTGSKGRAGSAWACARGVHACINRTGSRMIGGNGAGNQQVTGREVAEPPAAITEPAVA